MGRAPFVAGLTALGLVGVLTYHSQDPLSSIALGPKTHAASKAPATTTPAQSSPTTSPTTSTTAPANVVRSVTGPTENYGYGTIAVKVTASGTRITNLSTPGDYEHAQYSQQLAAQVLPMLRSEVLKAQSANINGISGASYTSQAYATSLQAALDQLHIP